MKGLAGLLIAAEAAELAGLATGTFRNYVQSGVAPPPVMHVGNTGLWSPDDVKFFRKTYKGKPWLRGVTGPRSRGRAFCKKGR